MKLLGLFGSAPAQAKLAVPAQQTPAQPAATSRRIIHVSLETAHLVLKRSHTGFQVEAPFGMETRPDGVHVTERANGVPGAICRLDIPLGATVDVQLASGGLTVRDFRGTLRARVLTGGVSVEQSEGTFRVVAPGGRIAFEQVRGEVDILTSTGNISVRRAQGSLQAVSSGGAMEFEEIDGSLTARTTNGSIEAYDLRGAARLSTRTGGVRISGACGQLRVRTHSGDIDVDCSIVEHTLLETYKGTLDLRLGPETNAHLEATVGKGTVRTERISPQPGTNRRTLRSTLGLGECRLRLESAAGMITVAGPLPTARVPRPPV